MKVKNVNLEWYVLRWDSTSNKVTKYNILHNLKDTIAREVRNKSIYDKSILREYLKTEFVYSYWSKSEHEMAVGGLFSKYPEEFEKIDIWQQIEPNLNNIVEYVNMKMELKFE